MPDGSYNPADELADLFPQPLEVKIGRRTLMVRALGVQDLIPVSKALRVAFTAMGDDQASEDYVATHVGDLLPMIALSTGIPVDTVARLPGGPQLALLAAVIEVNRDFFVQWFALKRGTIAGQLTDIMLGRGEPQSTTSEPTDIPSASATPPSASTGS